MRRTTAEIDGRVLSGTACTSCGTDYNNCTTLVLIHRRPCCGPCESRDTHQERVERKTRMKFSEVKIGQTVRVTRRISSVLNSPLVSVTNVYEGEVASVRGKSLTLKRGLSTSSFRDNASNEELTIELLKDVPPLDPGYYLVTTGGVHCGARYWDGEVWRRDKGGSRTYADSSYTVESALMEVPL